MCKVIILNPEALVPFFYDFCDAVLKWDVTHQPELKQTFLSVRNLEKGSWDLFF